MDREIFNALRKIKDICKSQGNDDNCCLTCPFGNDDEKCMFDLDIPSCWNLKETFEQLRYFEEGE